MRAIVIGAQWGDEGKGKICDYLAPNMDVVVRYGGGANAGHTVMLDSSTVVLHHIPSGILSPRPRCIIGNGCVVDPEGLAEELAHLASAGVSVPPDRLLVSPAAHLVTPLHRLLDARLNAHLGTTTRGIGPCYTDKVQRSGIRLERLLDGTWRTSLRDQARRLEPVLSAYGIEDFDVEAEIAHMEPFVEKVAPYVQDPVPVLHEAIEAGRHVLYEGAQGTFLDVDHGTYPYVTSSSTTIGGALTGAGVYVSFDRRIAVVKAYTTRVGEGPFPTELADETGAWLREVGHEYGATTRRPRRCGWLDLHLCRLACVINGFNYVVLTKLDCLTGLPHIRVAVGRDQAGLPTYLEVPGWDDPIAGVTSFDDLPPQARTYVELIEEHLGLRVGMISTGPQRHAVIVREAP